jgi:acylphosphatase
MAMTVQGCFLQLAKEQLTIHGDVAATDFPDWIIHRARRLGLKGGIVGVSNQAIELLIAGPIELLDAMEVGCSLGPTSVQVDSIERLVTDFDVTERSFGYIPDR